MMDKNKKEDLDDPFEDDYFDSSLEEPSNNYKTNSFKFNKIDIKKYIIYASVLVIIVIVLATFYNVMQSDNTIPFTNNTVNEILIDTNTITLYVDESYYLDPRSVDTNFSYGSLDPSICEVSDEGEIVGISSGTTTIFINNNSSSVFVNINVVKASEVIEILFDENIEIGTNYTTTIYPNNISNQYIENIEYTSSNPEILSIENGEFLGLMDGEVTIEAKLLYEDNYIYGSTIVKVVQEIIKPEAIIVDKDEITIKLNDKGNFNARIEPEDSSGEIVYLNYNKDIISVDDEGNYVGLKDGTATVAIYSSIDSAINKVVKVNVVGKQTIKIANNRGYIKCGDGPKYNAEMFSYIKAAGYRTREGVVAAAIYLASTMPERVPYFWAGGHYHSWYFKNKGNVSPHSGGNFIGVSEYFGCEAKMAFGGTDVQPNGSYFKFGLDCSGFDAWAILNGGYFTGSNTLIVSTSSTKVSSVGGISVTSSTFGAAKGKIKPGDLVFKKGHTGMIIGVTDSKIIVAEEAGGKSGLIITEAGLGGGKWVSVTLMDNFYNNYQKGKPLWSGFPQ